MKKITYLLGLCSFIFTANFAHAQSSSGYMNSSSQNYNSSYTTNYAQNSIKWYTNYDAAVAASRASSKPILILFTGTNWCPACMKLEKDVLTNPEFVQAVSNDLIFLKAEFPTYKAESISASPFKLLLDRYRVDTFPTMIAVNSEGHTLFSIPYSPGGAEKYVREIKEKLNSLR